MKFSIELGETEKHKLDCESNPFWGLFIIKVDDVERKKVRRLFYMPGKESHRLDIGLQERMEVTIEKERGLFNGETHRVFVNGRLVKCFSKGGMSLAE